MENTCIYHQKCMRLQSEQKLKNQPPCDLTTMQYYGNKPELESEQMYYMVAEQKAHLGGWA